MIKIELAVFLLQKRHICIRMPIKKVFDYMPAKKRECNRRRQYPYGLMTLQTEHLRAVRQHFRPVGDEKQGLVLCLVLQIQQ